MLTRSGFGLLLAAIVTLVCGVWWGYGELVVLAAGMGVLLLAAVVVARSRQSARVNRLTVDTRIARGLPFYVGYQINNKTRRRTPPIVIIDSLDGASVRCAVRSLGAHDSTVIRSSLPTRRRGLFPLGPGEIERLDPWGLAIGRRPEIAPSEVIVHPRVHPIDGPFGALHSQAEEATARTFASDPLSGFVSMHEYVPGDDPRLIHWPTSARTGTPMVREHVELRRPEFTVVIDAATTAASPDDFEEIVDVAASIAVRALALGMSVRVRTTNPTFAGSSTAFTRETDILDFLTDVVQVPPANSLELAQVLDHGRAVGLLTFVTGPTGPSTIVADHDQLRIVRIGADAEVSPGVQIAAATAAEFAQDWS